MPGNRAGLFLPDNNLAIHIDRWLQGAWQDVTPYSRILTSLSFGALTLMGSICGSLIRSRSSLRTIGQLLLMGSGSLFAALLTVTPYKIKKNAATHQGQQR